MCVCVYLLPQASSPVCSQVGEAGSEEAALSPAGGKKEESPLPGVTSGSSSTANGLCMSVELG